MMQPRHLFFTLLCLHLPSSFAENQSSDQIMPGPFPTHTTASTPFHFKLQIKLEGTTTINYPCVLHESTTASQAQIDATTGKPVMGANNKPVYNTVHLAAGLAIKGTEGYILSKGVTVIKDTISTTNLSSGRYAYLGDVPRFESSNLEMFASKMGHTLRVKAWVTQDKVDHYEETLVLRWKDRYSYFTKNTVHLYPLQSLQSMADATKNPGLKKMYQTASYYSAHYLDNTDPTMNIYDQSAKEADYANRILTEILRKSLADDTLTIQDGLKLASEYENPNFYQSRLTQSAALFQKHFASRYVSTVNAPVPQAPAPAPTAVSPSLTADAPVTAPPAPRLGYLTFVYPVAIDTKGPFGQPSPGLRQFPLAGTIEARWWSDRWQDEFGGFPFMLITDDGVAFHGPITLAGNVWMLRRADVSHSCMRMDPSDVLELRELLPKNILALQANHQTVPLRIMEWPDVDDLKQDGNLSVVDVAYYLMQGSGDNIVSAINWKPESIQKYFWTHTFSPYSNLLSSHNTFTVNTTVGTDGSTQYQGVFTGLPKYAVKNNELVKDGFYTQPTPIHTFDFRPTGIIQYREDGVSYNQNYHDNNGDNDSGGQSSPTRFQHSN